MFPYWGDRLAGEILDALGLKHVRKFCFRIAVNTTPTIEVEYLPEVDDIKRFPEILKKYKIDSSVPGWFAKWSDSVWHG